MYGTQIQQKKCQNQSCANHLKCAMKPIPDYFDLFYNVSVSSVKSENFNVVYEFC